MIFKPKILIVDDDLELLESLYDVLDQQGCIVAKAENATVALEQVKNDKFFDLAILDLKLPDMYGLDLLKEIKKIIPQISVIILTGYGTVESAVKAMKLGADEYLKKPFRPDELFIIIEKLYEYKKLQNKTRYLLEELSSKYKIENIVGQSNPMMDVFDKIANVAKSDTSVLIMGESGTGKELIAHHIHYASPRKDEPLIKVSCVAFAPGIIESEMFGHKKGAFTGAVATKKGRLELANRGTLFLDEVGDIPISYQPKLLRVLESMEFEKVGSSETIKSDFRLISATSHDLETDIDNETFRDDLYYRLNVVGIRLPSLRERREDIPLLLNHFFRLSSLLRLNLTITLNIRILY